MTYLMTIIDFMVLFVTFIFGIFVSLQFFDRLTRNIEEWKELKKGNVAVALLFASIILSLALFVSALNSYAPFSSYSVDPVFMNALLGKIFFVAYLLVGTLAAIVVLFVSTSIVDQLTPDIDELAELKKGNAAIALFISSILVSASFVLAPLLPPIIAGVVGMVSKMAGIMP